MAEGEAGFHKRSEAHTWQSGESNGKLEPETPAAQPLTQLTCPECGSQKLWKDGLRYVRSSNQPTQRWLCRNCSLRFSQPKSNNPEHFEHHSTVHTKSSYTKPTLLLTRQVCVTEAEGSKNLAEKETTRQEWAAGATTPDPAVVKGKLVEFAWWMQKEGYHEATIKNRVKVLQRLVNLGINLYDAESIKGILANQRKYIPDLKKEWSDGYKVNIVDTYTNFLTMQSLTWNPPRYKRPDQSFSFIPTETEIDELINGAGKMLGAFLQGLKDTGADPGELKAVTWTDVNEESRTVKINHPVKGHNPRVLKVSEQFINRLKALPKKGERIFRPNYQEGLERLRKRLAHTLQNPRLLKICFTTFRHWKGTMEYHRTKDIIYVQRLLGHKKIQTTMIYIDYEKACFGEPSQEEFTVRVATSVEEVCELIEAGFDYITGEYNDGGKIFRRRK